MEGNQVVLLLLKLLSMLTSKLSNILAKIGEAYLKSRQKKRELGLKKGKVLRADRVELLIAKGLKKTLVAREKNLEEKLRVSNFKLDCYKLEMQSKLAELEKNIRILQTNLDNATPENKLMFQKELHKALHEKNDFEKDVNKALLDKNREISTLEAEYKHVKKDLEICDKAIDGFDSKIANDMTESMRSNFESVVQKESLRESQPFERSKEIEQPFQQEFTQTSFENTVSNEISTDPSTGTETNIETDSVDQVDKKFTNNHEHQPVRTNKEPEKTTEVNNDDEFMKEYLEKQRRKSIAQEKQKDLSVER